MNTTPSLDQRIRAEVARGMRTEVDAARYNVLKAAGPDGHAEILVDWRTSGGDFDDAVDRYGKKLIGALRGSGRAA